MRTKKAAGCEIPVIGLGTWLMSGRSCVESVRSALELGYTHIDTARYYGNEREVGEGIRKSGLKREDVFITTKVWRTNLEGPQVISEVQKSLRDLKTDYADLLLIHFPSQSVPLEETLEAFEELKEEGRVRCIGVSNFTIPLLDKALSISDDIVCNQVECHPLFRQEEMVKYCQRKDLILTAYRPFGKGEILQDKTLNLIADKYDVSPAQVILNWLIQQDNVVTIPKAASQKHREDNIRALKWKLDDEDFERISSIKDQKRFCDQPFAPWHWS